MALLYLQGTTNPSPDYEKATEDIPEGALVVRESGGGCHQVDASSDSRVDGVALSLSAGDHIASHPFDYETDTDKFVYQPASSKDSSDFLPNSDDDVPISGNADGTHPIPSTIKDNGTDPAPSIDRNDVVGVAAVGANEQAEIQGRVVQEGYTDNGGTTYGRSSSGDFVALGRAEAVLENNAVGDMYDRMVVVRRDKSL